MTFGDDIEKFLGKLDGRNRDVFLNTVVAVQSSIVEGSAVTGAPGQPVDTGNLRASWRTEFEAADVAAITTNVAYAPPIEDGEGPHGPLALRSQVGGFHSVKLTRNGFQALVDDVTAKVNGER